MLVSLFNAQEYRIFGWVGAQGSLCLDFRGVCSKELG